MTFHLTHPNKINPCNIKAQKVMLFTTIKMYQYIPISVHHKGILLVKISQIFSEEQYI